MITYVCDILHILIGYLISNLCQSDINVKGRCLIGPGPLYITFGCNMPITLLHLMLMSKIYVVNSDMENLIGMSDPIVMFKGPRPMEI